MVTAGAAAAGGVGGKEKFVMCHDSLSDVMGTRIQRVTPFERRRTEEERLG